MLTHSHSSIKDFQGCARRYHQVRILKRFKQQPTEATTYGTLVHEAFEKYLMEDTPLPEHLGKHKPVLDKIKAMPGDRHCELKLGMRQDFTPCGFYDESVWLRGIPDLLIVNGATAWVGDWKTGKSSRYADTSQLELMAAMAMTHFPEVQKVKAMLFFIVPNDVILSLYKREQMPDILSKWAGHASMIEANLDKDVWNASPSGLCKFCPVSSEVCEHR
jgi:hypothetical protein